MAKITTILFSFFIFISILINNNQIFVNAQQQQQQQPQQQPQQTQQNPPAQTIPSDQPSDPVNPQPQPTTTVPPSDPSQVIDPSPSNPNPTLINPDTPALNVTTTTTTLITLISIPTVLPTPAQNNTVVVKTTVNNVKVTTTVAVKVYPQTTYVAYDAEEPENIETEKNLMKVLYIASAVLCTGLALAAGYTLYHKGLGDEAQASRTNWENSYEDDNYSRNKSTISRNTLTPSIRNTTLNSPAPSATMNSAATPQFR